MKTIKAANEVFFNPVDGEDTGASCTGCGVEFKAGDKITITPAPGTPSGQVAYCEKCAGSSVKADYPEQSLLEIAREQGRIERTRKHRDDPNSTAHKDAGSAYQSIYPNSTAGTAHKKAFVEGYESKEAPKQVAAAAGVKAWMAWSDDYQKENTGTLYSSTKQCLDYVRSNFKNWKLSGGVRDGFSIYVEDDATAGLSGPSKEESGEAKQIKDWITAKFHGALVESDEVDNLFYLNISNLPAEATKPVAAAMLTAEYSLTKATGRFRSLGKLGYLTLDGIEDPGSSIPGGMPTSDWALHRSNYLAAIEALPEGGESGSAAFIQAHPSEEYPGDVVIEDGMINIYEGAALSVETAKKMIADLERYPSLDDEDMSALEYEQYQESAEFSVREVMTELGFNQSADDIITDEEAAELEKLGTDEAGQVDMDILEGVDKILDGDAHKESVLKAIVSCFVDNGSESWDIEGIEEHLLEETKSIPDPEAEVHAFLAAEFKRYAALKTPGSKPYQDNLEEQGQLRLMESLKAAQPDGGDHGVEVCSLCGDPSAGPMKQYCGPEKCLKDGIATADISRAKAEVIKELAGLAELGNKVAADTLAMTSAGAHDDIIADSINMGVTDLASLLMEMNTVEGRLKAARTSVYALQAEQRRITGARLACDASGLARALSMAFGDGQQPEIFASASGEWASAGFMAGKTGMAISVAAYADGSYGVNAGKNPHEISGAIADTIISKSLYANSGDLVSIIAAAKKLLGTEDAIDENTYQINTDWTDDEIRRVIKIWNTAGAHAKDLDPKTSEKFFKQAAAGEKVLKEREERRTQPSGPRAALGFDGADFKAHLESVAKNVFKPK